jgi:hypothetical protein
MFVGLLRQIATIATPRFCRASRWRRILVLCGATLLLAIAANTPAQADTARFDLTGPKIEVRVTRAGVTLPISSVPNLQPGDRIWLHPNLPASQSIHYLMVLVFLRGTTNPPPDNWFTRIQTWDKNIREEGIEVTVPDEAQQAVLFLAPVTGGDFGTLRSAVQGRPGAFVRASQDLSLAGFEQARIERYVGAMRQVPVAETADPKALQDHSNLIAGTLALRPNADCVKLPPDQQYTCLTQSGNQMLLDDGHGESVVAALSNGPGSDFINEASYTSLAGGGNYSAYVGALVDLIHIMSTLHTAQYQYIPAIAFPQQQSLNLRLNMPPSFHNPKSVIVIGLPSVQSATLPPLRPSDPKFSYCLAKPGVVLPVEGAPLVFSTNFAHDLVLHLNYPAGTKPPATQAQDISLTADPYNGGLALTIVPKRRVLPTVKVSLPTLPAAAVQGTTTPAETQSDPATLDSANAGLTGTIQGFWGFDPFTGPTLSLQNTPGKDWKLTGDAPLIAGKDQQVLITSTGTACIQAITLDTAPATAAKQTWKPASESTVDVALKLSALPGHDPGTLHLTIHQFGEAKTDSVSLVSYSEPAQLTALEFRASDTYATLAGSSLDQVRQVDLGGATFTPDPAIPQPDTKPGLRLILPTGTTSPALSIGDKLTAQITLKDGRVLSLVTVVKPARPTVTIIGRAAVPPDAEADSKAKPGLDIKLISPNDLAIVETLLFSLKSAQPFPRTAQVEIASLDESLHTTLTIAAQTLILEDPQTILARFEPLKSFGPSAFGPLRLRVIAADGATGEWLPLVTLVRRPTLTSLNCPAVPVASDAPATPISTTPCTLTGSSLYLIDSVATDAAFTNPIRVPDGFVDSSLSVPAPTGSVYYVRLRDDPSVANTIGLPTGPL